MRLAFALCLCIGLLPAAATRAGQDALDRQAPSASVILPSAEPGSAAEAALDARLKAARWRISFGSEWLVGVDAAALDGWLSLPDARPGPARIAPAEIVVRDLVCTQHTPEPIVAVVGGYSLARRPPALARVAGLGGLGGLPVPADGVVARRASRPVMAKGSDPLTDDLISRIDSARWFGTLEQLAGFDRSSLGSGIHAAHDWILQRFTEAGLEASSHRFNLGSTSCAPAPGPALGNPIGFKRGHRQPQQWVVVGAHYDARNAALCDGGLNAQPGANDNASGCAGVIELARAFAQARTERSIVFACFAGEEQGLVGAYRYVDSLIASGQIADVVHMINLDMIAHATSDALFTRLETTSVHQAEFARYREAAARYAPELSLIEAGTQAYSDHWPFLRAGVPAMFTWENGVAIYPHYHQASDLPQNLQRAQALGRGILRMDAAVLAGLAGLIEPPLFEDGFESESASP
jgi:hypothetical protein